MGAIYPMAAQKQTPQSTRILDLTQRLLYAVHSRVFGWVLALLIEHGLVWDARTGVDISTLETGAPWRRIVRGDTSKDSRSMLKRVAVDSGIEMYERRIRFRSIWVVGAAVCFTFVVGVRAEEPIKPIPEEIEINTEKLMLGRMLFYDPRLSKNNTTSCYSCHNLGVGGDDGRKVFIRIGGEPGIINTPTVFNSDFNFKQFWDGRVNTVEDLIDTHVQSPTYLGSSWPGIVSKLYQHENYPSRFKALYPDGIHHKNIRNALGEFIRSLTTPNSRFDQYLEGDDTALSTLEKRGYALFKSYGCVSCHQGVNVGGGMFRVFGAVNDYFKNRGNITDVDLGRYNVTGKAADRHVFKVPSLRMAALTQPYLHNGSAATLRDAVDIMFEFQLGRKAPDEDKEAIMLFIKTLVGESMDLSP